MKKAAPLFIILAGICWGIIGVFSRALSDRGLSPIQITAIRCIVTAILLTLYTVIIDRKALRIRLRDIWYFIGTGVFSIVFFNICYFRTIALSSLSLAAILLYTAPCMVMIMSLFIFRERLTVPKAAALLLAFTGCLLITGVLGGGQSAGVPAILVGLGSGFGYALYSIFGGLALKKYSPVTVTVWTFLIAALALLPFCGLNGILYTAAEQPEVIPWGLLLAIVSTMIPFLLYTKGLQHMDAGSASIMAFVEPMVSTLAGVFFFQETLTRQHKIGVALIFLSVVLLNLRFGRKFSKKI